MKINKKAINENLNSNLLEDVNSEGSLPTDIDVTATSSGVEIETSVKMTDTTSDSAKPASKEDAIRIDNTITRVLDRAFNSAKNAIDEGRSNANCNVLVVGLPGSSKTASVYNWAKLNGCNIKYLDAKNGELSILVGGASSIDRTDPKNPKLLPAYSDALDALDRPNSILFLDELNRQQSQGLRGSLLTLLADRAVPGPGENGMRKFPNLLFTIACINPTEDEGDEGVSPLNNAEKRRFYYQVEFNSEVPATSEYLEKIYNNYIVRYYNKNKDTKTPEELIKKIDSFIFRQWLGQKIIHDRKFFYTTLDDIKSGRTSSSGSSDKIACQSTITELIENCDGNVEILKDDIASSGLYEDAKNMLLDIINRIVLPSDADIKRMRSRKLKELGIKIDYSDADVKSVSADSTKEPVSSEEDEYLDALFGDDGEEDDKDFVHPTAGVDTFKAASPDELKKRIEDAIRSMF